MLEIQARLFRHKIVLQLWQNFFVRNLLMTNLRNLLITNVVKHFKTFFFVTDDGAKFARMSNIASIFWLL